MFLLFPYVNMILIASAVIPAAALMHYVYNRDRLEKESRSLLMSLVINGVLATAIAAFAEQIGQGILGLFFQEETTLYRFLLFFLVVGGAEEGSKYWLLKRRTWNLGEFNCYYDAIVYAVFISLGFALWENISYVARFGLGTAMVRAVTAVPGHASFGVFMGAMYGRAKAHSLAGDEQQSLLYQRLALLIPVLLHGFYDFAATSQESHIAWFFTPFIIALFILSIRIIKTGSEGDSFFGRRPSV